MELRGVMIQIPNINIQALDQFDQKLMDPGVQKPTEKKRKDQFRKLIAGTIGVMSHLATRGHCYFAWQRNGNLLCTVAGSIISQQHDDSGWLCSAEENTAVPQPSWTIK